MPFRAVLLLSFLSASVLTRAAFAEPDGRALVGTKMPAMTFKRWIGTDDGQALDTSGRVVLYRWWTTGCGFCERSLPSIDALRKEYEQKGLSVVGVFHPKPPRDVDDKTISDGAAKLGFGGPVATDDDWSQLNRVWLTERRIATSVSILVDRKGVIRYVHPGPALFKSEKPEHAEQNAAFTALDTAIKTLLAEPAAPAEAKSWKAGAAAVKITPDKPVVMLGFPDRAGPFTSVAGDIFAKALALEDPTGHRAVIVTGDLVGFQAANSTDPVCERLEKLTGLPRERFIFNASHTHTGPVVSMRPQRTYNVGHPNMTDTDAANTVEYTKSLQDKLVNVVVEALGKLEPATLSWGKGSVDFPVSRRMPTPSGVVMAANHKGLRDTDVPVLRVDGADGKIHAILFGAACHNVAVGGATNVIHGDYAGSAQRLLQEAHPGAIAMFMAGCGADANPNPWGSLNLADKHGRTLADEVNKVLGSSIHPVRGALSTQFAKPEFPLQNMSRTEVEGWLKVPNFQSRQAKHMLEVLDGGGELLKSYPAPIAAWQIGDELTLVALPGEPVAEYVSLLQKALGERNLWVAGFNNDCFGYLPTAAVVNEGGHEAIGITLWAWGQDLDRYVAFFAPEVQDLVVKTATDLAKKAGRKI